MTLGSHGCGTPVPGAIQTRAVNTKPFVIGIAGGTGSGKTTIAEKIAAAVPFGTATVLTHDAYYRDLQALPHEERSRINFDHPDSLDTELLIEHLAQLRAGEAIEMPQYDFSKHARTPETIPVQPVPLLIVEGILVFVEPKLRELMDLKIFVDTDADIRILRRIRRDIEVRGRSFESIRDQYYATVRPMHLQFVEPSKRHADVILPEGGRTDVALDLILSKARVIAG